jgi:hypothetical protein
MPNGKQHAKIPDADRASPVPAHGEENTHGAPLADIQLLGAAAFGHLFASEQVADVFAMRLGESQGMLGASRDGITGGEGNPAMVNPGGGAAAVVAAAE